jgi:DHA1 family bicyclomycin/chloramphenicol resistance-like MFS transporter
MTLANPSALGPDTGSGATPHRTALVLVLSSLTALGPLSIDMYLPALPKLTRDLNGGPSLIQLTLTACLVGLAVGQAIVGPLSDLHGRRRPLLLGVTAYTLASLLCVVAPSAQFLILFRLLQGVAGGSAIVIARAVVRDLYDDVAAARFFGILMQVGGVAPIMAPIVGGALLKVTSWRGVFAVISALGVLLFLAVLRGLPETLPPAARQGDGPRAALRVFLRLTHERAFAGYALTSGFAFGAMFAYISGSPFVIQNVYGLPPLGFSAVFAANGIGIVLAGQISSHLVGRRTPRTLLIAGLATSLTGSALTLLSALTPLGLWALLPGLFLMVSAIGLVMPNATALALSGRPPHTAGSASALLGLAQFVIGGLAAPLTGVAGPHTSLPMAIVIAALSTAALVALTLTHTGQETDPLSSGS